MDPADKELLRECANTIVVYRRASDDGAAWVDALLKRVWDRLDSPDHQPPVTPPHP